MKTTIINLFGGPGSFKSSMAAFIFYTLKKRGIEVELVTEYAKDLVYREDWDRLEDQLHILSEQCRRQSTALGKTQFIITDSPLLLTLVYNKGSEWINQLAVEKFNSYNNINFFLVRSKDYSEIGRTQRLEEAIQIDEAILKMLNNYSIPFHIINSEEEILPWLMP